MSLSDVRTRVFNDEQFQLLFSSVVAESVASQFGDSLVREHSEVELPWNYLLTVASLLSKSDVGEHQDAALRIAQYCLVAEGPSQEEKSAAFVVLDDMANDPAARLAEQRELIPRELTQIAPFGIRARLLRNRLESIVELSDASTLRLTPFQHAFWDGLNNADWVSVSAPTSAGKSFLVTRWLLDHLQEAGGTIAYLVPTRALISQVEGDLKAAAAKARVDVNVATIPRPESLRPGSPTILVFTQERMHLLLTQGVGNPRVKHLVVDEAQKIGDRHRGVLLQHVIELLVESDSQLRVTFISPMTNNPAALFRDAPAGTQTQPVSSDGVTVNQNLIWATQVPRKPREWSIRVCHRSSMLDIGRLTLPFKPTPESKRLPFVASALATETGGSIVYVNGASDAEKTALQLYDLLGNDGVAPSDSGIPQLAELVQEVIHPGYLLAVVLQRRSAFHYGNMPLLIRTEIERLFSEGEIKYLVCTSTLVEGVNTACKTLAVRGPKKGRGNPMSAEDFWNLAGRAGRLGREFQGNIVCVDANKPNLWSGGEPPRERKQYVIERTTDEVLSSPTELLKYIEKGAPRSEAQRRPDLEYVSTYLMIMHGKYGTLAGSSWASALDANVLSSCDEAIRNAWESVEIPLEVAARSPGISPLAMQNLLTYFRRRTNEDKKPIEELMPAQPGSDDAAENYAAIIGRSANHLNFALGPAGKRSFALAILVTRWMRGFPLARLISDRIRLEGERRSSTGFRTIIRTVLDDVERIARFEAPRTITAYLDVLKLFLSESDRSELVDEIEDVSLFLEMGMSLPTQIALLGLGLSRSTAIRLSELIADDSLNERQARNWLEEGAWQSANLPALVVREVKNLLQAPTS